jgi:Dipeptidyl aminopeptidases/acylaminoacyl-peptidases
MWIRTASWSPAAPPAATSLDGRHDAEEGPPGTTHKVAAVINFYGITDVEDQLQGEHMRKYAVTWVPEREGRFELARRLSPMTYIRKDVPPILTIHGNADETVPYEHGVSLTKALRDAGGMLK